MCCRLLSGPSWCELQGSQCHHDGSFLPLQCDVTSCWCVSEDGQEVVGTRVPRQTGRMPSCDRRYLSALRWLEELQLWPQLMGLFLQFPGPLCPSTTVSHGAVVCQPAADGHQSCNLICHHGYQNALPVSSFFCKKESLQWAGELKPLGGACQSKKPNHQSKVLNVPGCPQTSDVLRLKFLFLLC